MNKVLQTNEMFFNNFRSSIYNVNRMNTFTFQDMYTLNRSDEE